MSAFEAIPRKSRDYQANRFKKAPKMKSFDPIETGPTDGHVLLSFKKKDLKDVFEAPVDVGDIVLDPITVKTSSKVGAVVSKTNVADWDEIKEGKWTIEKMRSLVFINNLPQPTKKSREGYVDYLLEHRKEIAY